MNSADGQAADPADSDALATLGLPAAWRGKAQWRVLQSGFAQGKDFLEAWSAWRRDPRRPALLHWVALEETPCPAAAIVDLADTYPAWRPLAQALASQWFGLVPGFHRLAFEDGRVLLTVCVGESRGALRGLSFSADSVLLGGGASADLYRLKAIARLCRRGTRLAAPTQWMPLSGALRQCGFTDEGDGHSQAAPVGASWGSVVFAPAWQEKRPVRPVPVAAGRCVVVGGGLAGAAVAASLARRGWEVEVLDATAAPASGASSLPAGLLVAHQSPDDSLLSRLSRAGVRMVLAEAARLLRDGEDWARSGVLAHRPDALSALPPAPPAGLEDWSRAATAEQKARAGLDPAVAALWHTQAGWIKPAALVAAWLAQQGVRWRGDTRVARILRYGAGWTLRDARDGEIAHAPLVIVAAALGSAPLLPIALPLQPVRGQVSWASHAGTPPLPPFPVNGQGHFLPGVPLNGSTGWLCGATFDRDDTDLAERPPDHAANLRRLEALLPSVAVQLEPLFAAAQVRAWTGVRCASADRRPLAGEVAPGLWVTTAMGSRGLSFAHLCAEIVAARLHGEPLPLPRALCDSLDPHRARGRAVA